MKCPNCGFIWQRLPWWSALVLAWALMMFIGVVVARAQSDYTLRFEQHRPNYIISHYSEDREGTESPWAKFQLSFKHPATRQITLPTEYLPDFQPYIAITTTAWWRILDESAPFDETNYKPEVWLEFANVPAMFDHVRVGYRHASNGEGGDSSRGWDRIFASAAASWRALTLTVEPEFIINTDAGTHGIRDVAGVWKDLAGTVELTLDTGANIYTLRAGKTWGDLDVMVRLHERYNLFMFLQGHMGNHEGLENYAQERTTGGAGIALIR